MLEVQEVDGGVGFTLRVQPRARRDSLAGLHDGALKVAVRAPPVDGAANTAVVALLAKRLGVRKADVTIVAGASGRSKRVEVRGVDAAAARALIGGR